MLTIHRFLFPRPSYFEHEGMTFRITESDGASHFMARLPPAEGAKRVDYEERSVEVALVTTKQAGSGKPLAWNPLEPTEAAAVVVAARIGFDPEALDAAAALANKAVEALENKVEALEEALKVMGALDEMGSDDRLDEEERRKIYGWIPAAAYPELRARIKVAMAELPALELAVREAEAAVNATEEPVEPTVGPTWWESWREATPTETGAALGVAGPARIDNLELLIPR